MVRFCPSGKVPSSRLNKIIPLSFLGFAPVASLRTLPWHVGAVPAVFAVFSDSSTGKSSIYNILWALVFGFATLNILSLVTRRFEPTKRRMSFGEGLAVMVVIVAVILLGWEMLYVFNILPIKLEPR